MKSLRLMIPPAFLMLIFMAVMWSMDYLLPGFKLDWAWSEWPSSALMLIAITCVVSGIISFKKAQTTVDPTQPEKATTIVTTGIYRVTRNPMYLGFLIMLLALAVKLANPITWLVPLVFVWYMNQFQIKPEEQVLTELFGATYQQYLAQVRRWI